MDIVLEFLKSSVLDYWSFFGQIHREMMSKSVRLLLIVRKMSAKNLARFKITFLAKCWFYFAQITSKCRGRGQESDAQGSVQKIKRQWVLLRIQSSGHNSEHSCGQTHAGPSSLTCLHPKTGGYVTFCGTCVGS